MDVAPKPPSILYVITKGSWGGAQRYVYELALEAKTKGYTVCVASGTQGELIERLTEAGVPVVRIPGLARDIRLGADMRAYHSCVRCALTLCTPTVQRLAS
jgi:hypothetical protein